MPNQDSKMMFAELYRRVMLQYPCLTVDTTESRIGWRHAARTDGRSDARSRARGNGWVGAKHANPGAKLGSTKGNHVLADVTCNNLSMLRVGVGKNVLDEIVAVLIAGNIDEWDTWTIRTPFADTIEISAEKFDTTNLEAFLDNLGGKLIHAVFRRVSDDVINSTAAISWGTMLANMLDAPVAELTMSDNINAGENFLDTWTL
jgi:hypothetical protein